MPNHPIIAKLRDKAIAHSSKLKDALVFVVAACGNPDYNQDPDKPMYGTQPEILAAPTFDGVVRGCRSFIDQHNLGGGNWVGGQIYYRGEPIAHVAYNGRIWVGESLSNNFQWVEIRPDAAPEDVLAGDRHKFELVPPPKAAPVEPSNWTNLVRRKVWIEMGGDEKRLQQYRAEYAQFKQAVIEEMHDHLFGDQAMFGIDAPLVVVAPVKARLPHGNGEEGALIPRFDVLEADDFANAWGVFNGRERNDDTVLAIYPCPMEAAAAAHRLTYWFDVKTESVGQQAHMALALCRLVGHAESQSADQGLNEAAVRDVLNDIQAKVPRLQTVLSADIINREEPGPR